MRLLEFQAKRIFKEYSIPIPSGRVLTPGESLDNFDLPVVLKAQVPVGGRGKAGGIRKVNTLPEFAEAARELFQMTIKGHPIGALLVEEPVSVSKEMYLAILYDKKNNLPVIMGSAAGGVDIEQVARESPEKICKQYLDVIGGLQPFMIRRLAKQLGVKDTAGLSRIVENMLKILVERDATLVEINPLVETPAGMLALDAKMMLDDRAEFRQASLFSQLSEEQNRLDESGKTPAELKARKFGVTYVTLDGNVGMIADGAGTGMLTLDLIQDEGGQAANFCEMGGLANDEVVYNALQVVMANPAVKSLVITLIGGLTRMDEIGTGIARYQRDFGMTVPLVVRMCGTEEEAGKAALREVGIDTFSDMAEAVKSAVALAGRN